MQTLTIDLIASDASIRNGDPCLQGTGIRVTDIAVVHLFHHRTVDEIASDYDLSLAQVYATLYNTSTVRLSTCAQSHCAPQPGSSGGRMKPRSGRGGLSRPISWPIASRLPPGKYS